MIRFRLVLFQIAGILALAWILVASHNAYAAVHHHTVVHHAIVGSTERCMVHTLVSDHISTHDARHLRIGQRVHVANKTIALKKGDTIWRLCHQLAKPIVRTATVPRPAPGLESEALARAPRPGSEALAQIRGDIAALTKELASTKAQFVSTQDQITAASHRVATAGDELTKAIAALNTASATYTNTSTNTARLATTERETWLMRTVLILGGIALLALIALAALIAYFSAERRRIERVSTQRRQELVETAATARNQVDKWRTLLNGLWPCLTLGQVTYELAPDAVEEPVPAERRTFAIDLTGMSRRNDQLIINCRLPWGELRTYDPPALVRELHSEAARAYYQSQAGIRLKPDVTGRRILAANLPDFNKLCMEAEKALAEPRTRVMTAA